MKNLSVQLSKRLIVLAISLFLLGLSPLYGQIGYLGVYGSAPAAVRSNVRFVRIEDELQWDPGFSYVMPVNGLTNFNFYYKPDGSGFLPGGDYKVTYLDSTKTVSYGYDIVTYSPNNGHTNGVEVRPFNNSERMAPRGMHGTFLGYVPNGGGSVAPIENATVSVVAGPYSVDVRINAAGLFSIYYTNETPAQFLWNVQHWSLVVDGTQYGCTYQTTIPSNSMPFWHPSNTTNPALETYYVESASVPVYIPILSPSSCS